MARVLVVDDDDDIRDVLRRVLEGAGHDVASASDGRDALRQVRSEGTDVVILDILMPVKEGIETLQELLVEFPKLGVLAMSGGGLLPSDDYLSSARLFGAARSLAKPFDLEELLQAVDDLFDPARG